MSAIIEVELRGPLDAELRGRSCTAAKFHDLLIDRGAQLKGREKRLLLDLSTDPIESRALDVRVRSINGRSEIVVKRGGISQSAREEARVCLADHQLHQAVRLCAMLGYSTAVACDRRRIKYQLDDLEIVVEEVRYFSQPDKLHSSFFEAELIATEETKVQAEARVRERLDQLGLPIFERSEFNAYVHKLNQEANFIYRVGQDPESMLDGFQAESRV